VNLADIDYNLPDHFIAQVPMEPRDAARLLVYVNGEVEHKKVSDINDFLQAGDVLVVNETRVLPSRLSLVRSTGGRVEVLLLEPLQEDDSEWEALIRPGRKMRVGEFLATTAGDEFAEVLGRSAAGDTFRIRICAGYTSGERRAAIEAVGSLPLPPYITTTLEDLERYQTVYAQQAKSSAAPTAGLHFTAELLEKIEKMGVVIAKVELVVGLDTFKPVDEENPLNHVIHSEWYNVPQETMQLVENAQRVVAVGTTSVRALESVAVAGELTGRTRLFITPGYSWKYVDLMMTNFHMPRTTLLLMVQAFIGESWRDLYAEALQENYRFLSFGDAMLLARLDNSTTESDL
jgi:S-adenosylmethionine:tRNA ribosyltransferase-isomerase